MATKFESLINNQYTGGIRLRQIGGTVYMGHDFKLTPNPTQWNTQLGRYPGRYEGTDVDLHGYWIYLPGQNKVWQAPNRGYSGLRYWNEDGQAVAAPEDWELFAFDPVSASEQRVRIYNAAFIPWANATGRRREKWITEERYYIGLTGTAFDCNEKKLNGAQFFVEFV